MKFINYTEGAILDTVTIASNDSSQIPLRQTMHDSENVPSIHSCCNLFQSQTIFRAIRSLMNMTCPHIHTVFIIRIRIRMSPFSSHWTLGIIHFRNSSSVAYRYTAFFANLASIHLKTPSSLVYRYALPSVTMPSYLEIPRTPFTFRWYNRHPAIFKASVLLNI